MIILDEQEEHQVKFDSFALETVRYPEKALGRSSSPLPDYEASEAQHQLDIKNLYPPRKKQAGGRILKATFYALAIYVALSAVIALPIILTRRKDEVYISSRPPNPSSFWIGSSSIISPPPSFSSASLIPFSSSMSTDCTSWTKTVGASWTLQATLKQNFSAAESIAIRSNLTDDVFSVTNGVFGNLTVDMNPDPKATETLIKLQATASDYTLLEQTNVCIYSNYSESGLTIYAPGNLSSLQFLSFDVHLLFPRQSSPYVVPELTIYLPQFFQYYASLSKYVTFNQVSIFGTQSDITCQSIEAPIVGIKNVRAAITGTFNVSLSLILDTIYGAITSNITLASITQTPTLLLDTGSAPIYADIFLTSPSSIPPVPFRGHVKTFAAPIDLFVKTDASANLPLNLFVVNNGAPTNITLDLLYQGQFDIQSKLAPVSLNNSQPQSQITYDTQSYERLSGCIGNGSRGSTRMLGGGQIEVVSALASVDLNIGPGTP